LAVCRRVADELSHQIKPNSNWSGNYIHQVAHGKLPVSRRLAQSINKLFSKHSIDVEYEAVVVLAPVGYVSPYSMVVIPSQKCASGGCGRMFIPCNPRQKYCNEKCRKAKRRIKNAS
jgi:hypothetical protein